MFYKKISVVAVVAIALVACSRHSADYIRQSQMVQPMVVPPGIALKPADTYYPVPNGAPTETKPPSTEPPGSNLQRFKKKKNTTVSMQTTSTPVVASASPSPTESVQTPATVVAESTPEQDAAPQLAKADGAIELPEAAQTVNVAETLTISQNPQQAWAQIGKALRGTSYQVLDQDQSMNSYYILDAVSTDNQVTKATPIYRVYLKAVGNQTEVSILDHNNQRASSDVASRIIDAIQHHLG